MCGGEKGERRTVAMTARECTESAAPSVFSSLCCEKLVPAVPWKSWKETLGQFTEKDKNYTSNIADTK